MTSFNQADGLFFASLFLSESDRNQILSNYFRQQSFEKGNPLFTATAVMTGNIDSLFENSHL